MLEERRKEHIDQFIQTEKTLNEAFLLKQQLKELQLSWQQRDRQMLANDPNLKDRLHKMYELIEKEMEFVASCAARDALEARVEELTQLRDQRSTIMNTLSAKTQQILQLDESIQHRERMIETLSYGNSETRRNIIKQRNDTLDAIDTHVAHYRESIPIKISFFQGCFGRELNSFFGTDWNTFLHVDDLNGRRIQERRLTMNAFDDRNDAKEMQELRRTATLLRYPMYKTPESFVVHVSQIRHEALAAEASRRRLQEALAQASELEALHEYNHERVSNIVSACKELEQQQYDSWLPSCQRTIQDCEQALIECDQVKRLGDDWFTSPANSIPWEYLVQNQ
jgi:hypothetical protein